MSVQTSAPQSQSIGHLLRQTNVQLVILLVVLFTGFSLGVDRFFRPNPSGPWASRFPASASCRWQ